MKKILTLLLMLFAIATINAQTRVFYENFDATEGTDLPDGWFLDHVAGTAWTTGTFWSSAGGGDVNAYGGQGRSLGTRYGTAVQNSWLYTPALNEGEPLEAGFYQLKFMLVCRAGWITYGTMYAPPTLSVYYGTEQEEMTELLITVPAADRASWAEFVVDFELTEGGTYYIGFRLSGGSTSTWAMGIDEISIDNIPPTPALTTTMVYPYAQVPSFMSAPAFTVNVENTGTMDLTNVVLSATLNGDDAGSANATEDFVRGVSEQFIFSPTGNLVTGTNTVVFTADADEAPENTQRITSATFTGTRNVYAAETGTAGNLAGLAAAGYAGNVYEISEDATLSQFQVRFSNTTVGVYDLYLFSVNEDLTVDAAANFIYKQEGISKRNTGYYPANVMTEDLTEPLVLQPGKYFLSVLQPTATTMGYGFAGTDGGNAVSYQLSAAGAAEGPAALTSFTAGGSSSVVLRMVFESTECDEYEVSNPAATASATTNSATLTWTGTSGAAKYLLVLTDEYGNALEYVYRPATATTTACTYTATGLNYGVEYSWTVTPYCDAENLGNTADGPAFTTLDAIKFTQNFDGVSVGAGGSTSTFPAGWLNEAIGTLNAPWSIVNNNTTAPLQLAGSTNYASLTMFSGVSVYAFTPGLALEEGVSYRLSFYLYMPASVYGMGNPNFDVIISGTQSSSAADVEIIGQFTDAYGSWTYVYVDFEVEEEGLYYIGFAPSGTYTGTMVAFDNVVLSTSPEFAVQIAADRFPYVAFPTTTLSLPTLSATAINIGVDDLTDVVLTATLNGTALEGDSDPVATLAAGDSETVTFVPEEDQFFKDGSNTLVYKLGAEEEIDEAVITATFSVTGTLNTLAVENDATTGNPANIGRGAGLANGLIGNIFEIHQTTTLSQVLVNFAASATNLDYNIELYALTSGSLEFDYDNADPIFSQAATRTAEGWARVTVPQEALAPGSYFLALTQTSDAGIQVRCNPTPGGALGYTVAEGEEALQAYANTTGDGAFAIRMIVQLDECPLKPTDVAFVVGNTFSWKGDASNYLLTLTDSEGEEKTYETTATTYTFDEWDDFLVEGETYTLTVAAFCDAVNTGDAVDGGSFIAVNCPADAVVNAFPWELDYAVTCLTNEITAGTRRWITGENGVAYFPNDGSNNGSVTKLVLPKFDFSGSTGAVKLSLSYLLEATEDGAPSDQLRVYYKTSAAGTWTRLATTFSTTTSPSQATYTAVTADWTDLEFYLPNPSADYYVAFEGTTQYGGAGVSVDKIKVVQAACTDCGCDLAGISTFPWKYGFEGGNVDDFDNNFANCWEQEIYIGDRALGRWEKASTGYVGSSGSGVTADGTGGYTPNLGRNPDFVPKSAHSGDYMALYYNYSNTATAKLVLPKMDLSTLEKPTLSFWRIQEWLSSGTAATYPGDRLVVYYKASDDAAWTTLQEWSGTCREWTLAAVELPNKSANYHIAFGISNPNYGGGTAIDDITISEPYSEVTAIAVAAPVDAKAIGETTVKATVMNVGNTAITAEAEVPIFYTLDGGEPVEDVITGVTIAVGATYTFEFENDPITLEDYTTYDICVYTEVENKICALVENLGPDTYEFALTITAPVDNFEGEDLTSVAVSITVKNEGEIDVTNVPVWFVVNEGTENEKASAKETIASIVAGEEANHTFTAEADLSTPGTYTIKVYTSYEDVADEIDYVTEGVDEVTVTHTIVYDVEVVAVTEPHSAKQIAEAKTVVATVKNNSNVPVKDVPIFYTVNGGSLVEEVITDEIAVGETYEYAFEAKADITTAGTTYKICVYTELAGDVDADNDEQCIDVLNSDHDIYTFVVTVTEPTGLTSAETVSIDIDYTGTVTTVEVPVYLIVNGDTIAKETADVEAGVSATHTFATTVDLSTPGTYTIKVGTNFAKIEDDDAVTNGTDETEVVHAAVYDAGVTAITSPVTGQGLGQETVTITVKNYGNVALSNVPVYYTVDGGAQVTGTVPGPIAVGGDEVYSFATLADLSTEGKTYAIVASTALVGDADATNDAANKSVTHEETVIVPDVYDAGVTAIVNPVDGNDLGEQTVTIKVKNFGDVALASVPVFYTVNGGAAVSGTVPSIAVGAEVNYDFATKVDLSAAGTYTIRAYTALADDADATNDAYEVTITVTTSSTSVGALQGEVVFTVYPNPVGEELFIQTSANVKRADIFDAQGRLVKAVQNDTQKIAVGELKAGVYILQLTTEYGTTSQRFIKK